MIPTYHIKVYVCCSLPISTPLYPFQPCHDGGETLYGGFRHMKVNIELSQSQLSHYYHFKKGNGIMTQMGSLLGYWGKLKL